MDALDLDLIEWSDPSPFSATGVHSGYRRNKGHLDSSLFDGGSGWVSRIEPGGFIIPHRDAGPYKRRYQIPIEPAGWFWSEATGWFQPTGRFDVQHWLPHAVVNTTNRPRIHLVVDSAVVAVEARQGFETYDWPDDMPDEVREVVHG